jgi:hypothetical protein
MSKVLLKGRTTESYDDPPMIGHSHTQPTWSLKIAPVAIQEETTPKGKPSIKPNIKNPLGRDIHGFPGSSKPGSKRGSATHSHNHSGLSSGHHSHKELPKKSAFVHS